MSKKGKRFNTKERREKNMLETILDIILYIPRKIANHFYTFRCLKEDNQLQEKIIKNQKIILKRIIEECERTSYGNEQARVRKIKELAKTFPNAY